MNGVIYYSDSLISEPITSTVREYILRSGLPVVSVTLKPLDFGKNIVLNLERGYIAYTTQITAALENSDAENVFFCEHDVLYHPSHFEFTPPEKDVFYFNRNVWRWNINSDKAVRYDRMWPLSAMCANREFALAHYRLRMSLIDKHRDELRTREPALARAWGYEPGKAVRRGGIADDKTGTWCSEYPIIDIRHGGTFSPAKDTIGSFKHKPQNWEEIHIKEIPGWNLASLFPQGTRSS